MIYLDNAATTYPKPEPVYAALDKANRELAVNAGRGSYRAAREAADIITETKEKLLKLFNAFGYAQIAFTPSITHAMNQIIHGAGLKEGDVIYMSPYEHNAVARTVAGAEERYGIKYKLLPVKDDLEIDIEKLEYVFSQEKPAMVICTAVSNVTGYVLPVKEIFTTAKAQGSMTVLDAAQAAGLLKIDQRNLCADIVAFAGHKTLYGPFGIAGFSIVNKVKLEHVLTGGTGSDSLKLNMPETTPARYEASSQNIVAVCGLREALRYLSEHDHYKKIKSLTEYLINRLKSIDGIRLMGMIPGCNPLGIVSFVCENYSASEIGEILDLEYDIAVRTGYHCAPFIHQFLKDEPYGGTVRIGLGMFNTEADIEKIAEALESL